MDGFTSVSLEDSPAKTKQHIIVIKIVIDFVVCCYIISFIGVTIVIIISSIEG